MMAQDPSEIDPVDPELDLEDEPGDPAGEPDELPEIDDDSQEAAPPEPERDQQPSRRDGRIQRLVEESRRRDAENAELRRRLDELAARTTQPAQPQPQRESDAERAARYESMSPGQAMVEALKEAESRFEQRMNFTSAQTADSVDRTSFQARAARDKRVAKWLPKVETKLAELRQQGINMNRDVLYKYMLGEAMDAAGSTPEAERQTVEARRRVQQRSRRPGDTGSDLSVSRETRRSGSDEATARERRLSNQLL